MTAADPWKHELLNGNINVRSVTHVIFDFDGTLSWLRSGWPDIMTGLFAEYLPDALRDLPASRESLRREILALNGKPSIYQMRRFCEQARELRASPPSPEELLNYYLARLNQALQGRIDSLRNQKETPEQFLIAGVLGLLNDLQSRKLRLIILSGTAELDVRREAELLGLTRFFGNYIYGSAPAKEFSKKDVIDRLLKEEGIEGRHLLSFGDGPVEIEFTKAVGGLAVGVASDEQTNGSGVIDNDKREHLVRAGADAIIPDYRNKRWILETFFP